MNQHILPHYFNDSSGVSRKASDMIGVLDLGSSKLACLIAEFQADSTGPDLLRVRGFGHHVSHGIRAGQIVDMDAAEGAIRKVVHAAERMAGVKLSTIILGSPPAGLSSGLYTGEVALNGHPIGDEHVNQCIFLAQQRHHFSDGRIIHVLPTIYAIDDDKYIENPLGMYGDRLCVTVHVISVPNKLVRNLCACLERCHLEAERFIAAPYASALAVLTEEEMLLGAFHIDMGASMSSFSIYHRHTPIFNGMVPIGGGHITRDIAHGLGVSIETAEKMKTMHGSALSGGHEHFRFPSRDGTLCEYSCSQLREIIYPRLEETFHTIDQVLTGSGYKDYGGAHAVLTGGAAELPGSCEVAHHVFGKSVRIARPPLLDEMPSVLSGGGFSVARGILHYMAYNHNDRFYAPSLSLDWRSRVGHWLRRFLP